MCNELLLVLCTDKVQNDINCLMDLVFVLRLFSCIMGGGKRGGGKREGGASAFYCTWTVASLNKVIGAGLVSRFQPDHFLPHPWLA